MEKKEKGIKEGFKEVKKNMRANVYKSIQNTENMILTTTNEIAGHNITEYIGIVAGTDIYLIGGFFGGGLASQEQLYASALMNATNKLKENAEAIGANAVIGIQSNLTSTGGTNHIIVTLTGTAVKIIQIKNLDEFNIKENEIKLGDLEEKTDYAIIMAWSVYFCTDLSVQLPIK